MKNVRVSVVIPVYNEIRYIEKCIQSILNQDFPRDNIEYIFVDGMSCDGTCEILNDYAERYPDLIRVLKNPKRIAPSAMNIGILESKGDYIVRLDAHSDYPADYISKCIHCLENTDADNVGGLAETRANGFVGNAIAKVLSSRFGVGNSAFRTGCESGYVDTVPFGAFRKSTFDKYGLFDERLARNEDNEINYRIRKNGGKVYLSNDIKFVYYCRDTIKSLSKMAWQNGKWNLISLRLCPGSMGIRHFVPLIFVLSVFGLASLGFVHWIFWAILVAECILYSSIDVLISARASQSVKEFALVWILFPIFHCSYGIGSIFGLVKMVFVR